MRKIIASMAIVWIVSIAVLYTGMAIANNGYDINHWSENAREIAGFLFVTSFLISVFITGLISLHEK